jgi:hypothetical protein
MHPERVVIARVFAVVVTTVVTIVAAVDVATADGALGSIFHRHLLPNTSRYLPFRRPPTSSGYDHRNSHSPHNI